MGILWQIFLAKEKVEKRDFFSWLLSGEKSLQKKI